MKMTLKSVAIVLALAAHPTGNAASLAYTYSGQLLQVDIVSGNQDDIAGLLTQFGIVVGASFGGGLVLDTTATDIRPDDPNVGIYPQSQQTMSIQLGQLETSTSVTSFDTGRLTMANDRQNNLGDLLGTGFVASILLPDSGFVQLEGEFVTFSAQVPIPASGLLLVSAVSLVTFVRRCT